MNRKRLNGKLYDVLLLLFTTDIIKKIQTKSRLRINLFNESAKNRFDIKTEILYKDYSNLKEHHQVFILHYQNIYKITKKFLFYYDIPPVFTLKNIFIHILHYLGTTYKKKSFQIIIN